MKNNLIYFQVFLSNVNIHIANDSANLNVTSSIVELGVKSDGKPLFDSNDTETGTRRRRRAIAEALNVEVELNVNEVLQMNDCFKEIILICNSYCCRG